MLQSPSGAGRVGDALAAASDVLARVGRSAASAGSNAAETIEASTARAYVTIDGPPVSATTVMQATIDARERSAAGMTRGRDTGSARSASQGAKSAASAQRAKKTIPTAFAPSSL